VARSPAVVACKIPGKPFRLNMGSFSSKAERYIMMTKK
jgi:hypothetical protein